MTDQARFSETQHHNSAGHDSVWSEVSSAITRGATVAGAALEELARESVSGGLAERIGSSVGGTMSDGIKKEARASSAGDQKAVSEAVGAGKAVGAAVENTLGAGLAGSFMTGMKNELKAEASAVARGGAGIANSIEKAVEKAGAAIGVGAGLASGDPEALGAAAAAVATEMIGAGAAGKAAASAAAGKEARQPAEKQAEKKDGKQQAADEVKAARKGYEEAITGGDRETTSHKFVDELMSAPREVYDYLRKHPAAVLDAFGPAPMIIDYAVSHATHAARDK